MPICSEFKTRSFRVQIWNIIHFVLPFQDTIMIYDHGMGFKIFLPGLPIPYLLTDFRTS